MMDKYEKNTGFESETTVDDKMPLFRLREISGQGNTEARIIMGKKYLKQTIHIQRVTKKNYNLILD